MGENHSGLTITVTHPELHTQQSCFDLEGIFLSEFLNICFCGGFKDQTQGTVSYLGQMQWGGGRTGVEGGSKGGMVDTHLDILSSPPAWLTLNVFLPTITILFLIVGQLSLLVGLILTHVPIIPIVVR